MDKKKLLLLLGVLALAALIVGATTLYQGLIKDNAPGQLATQGEPNPNTTPTGETEPSSTEPSSQPTAPDFTVYDINGNEVHLSDYLGTPVVVNFWASWCGPCKSEMPEFDAVSAEMEGKVQFLMVNMTDGYRETIQKAQDFITEEGYSFPVFYDTASNAAMTYGVSSLPTTYFIDAEGHAIARAVGAIDGETLKKGISMIMPEA